MDEKQTSELRSGVTAPFNKRINEALQFNPQMPFHIENNVSPSLLVGVLKGEQGTPGLPATCSVVKDDNNLVALATSNIERGSLVNYVLTTTPTGAGTTTNDFTPPAGKKWIVKAVHTYGSSLVSTITRSQIRIRTNATDVTLYSVNSTDAMVWQPVNNITLGTTNTLRTAITLSAYTSGDWVSNILVQEFNI